MTIRLVKKVTTISAIIAIVVMVFYAVHLLAAHEIKRLSQGQLDVLANDLEKRITAPQALLHTLTSHQLVRSLLQDQKNQTVVSQLNLAFQRIQQISGVSVVYLMNNDGIILASSNWDTPESFVNGDFHYRQYFIDAMRAGIGRYYGVGVNTNKAGYYQAEALYDENGRIGNSKPLGVIVIKTTLADLESSWGNIDSPITVADEYGVIFLSNRADWKYHSLREISTFEKGEIIKTQRYLRQNVTALNPADINELVSLDGVGKAIGPLNWQVRIHQSKAVPLLASAAMAMVTLLIVLMILSIRMAARQREQRLAEAKKAQEQLMLMKTELESKIYDRVETLSKTNQVLAEKYDSLKKADEVLRLTQAELVNAGKLTTLGQLAAGVTHEFSQPLSAIKSFAENAIKYMQRNRLENVQENLELICTASDRMARLIEDLKGMARQDATLYKKVNLATVIDTSINLLRPEINKHQVQVLFDIDRDVHILGASIRMEQVLINLLKNSIDALIDQPIKSINIHLQKKNGLAELRIADSGCGIPESAIPHLFEPFFSTKPSGSGLGLGLAISASIVHSMNGKLEFKKNNPQGSIFSISIPTISEPV